jgi:hypothetical protein
MQVLGHHLGAAQVFHYRLNLVFEFSPHFGRRNLSALE